MVVSKSREKSRRGVRRQTQESGDFSVRLLDRLQQPCNGRQLICDLLMMIQEFTGVEAVGLRLRDEHDFPFHEVCGFPPGFLDAERQLFPAAPAEGEAGGDSCYRQIAARVVRRLTDPRHPFFTERGSFWTSCLSDLLASPRDREVLGCTGKGTEANPSAYESVALIPLGCGDPLVGLLELHDRRPGVVREEQVHFLEQTGAGLVLAVNRVRDEMQREQNQAEVERGVELSAGELRRIAEELRWEIAERQHMQAELMEQKQQLQALASELFLAGEQERRRLAAGLHDQVGALLAATCLKLGDACDKASPELRQRLAEIQALLRQTVRETQAMMFELASPVLYELGLGEALAQLAEQISEEHGVQVETVLAAGADTPDLDIRSVLYRGARELLANVVKHAQAKSARLILREVAGGLEVSVEDDGLGFDAVGAGLSLGTQGGFGLFNLRQQLQYFGGSLQGAAVPGRGVCLTMRCPRCPAPMGQNGRGRGANDGTGTGPNARNTP